MGIFISPLERYIHVKDSVSEKNEYPFTCEPVQIVALPNLAKQMKLNMVITDISVKRW